MVNARPPAILVMAILNTVIGGLALLGGICAGINVMLVPLVSTMTKGMPNDPLGKMTQIHGYMPFEVFTAVFWIVFAVFLLMSGIGMFSAKPWARYLAIFVGVVLILEQSAVVAFQIIYLNPLLLKANQEQLQHMPGMNALNLQPLATAVAALKAAVLIVYALALLIAMFLPSVRAGFRPRVRADRQDAGYDDNTVVEDQDFHDREERRP
jgi:hypothetical protein